MTRHVLTTPYNNLRKKSPPHNPKTHTQPNNTSTQLAIKSTYWPRIFRVKKSIEALNFEQEETAFTKKAEKVLKYLTTEENAIFSNDGQLLKTLNE